MLGLPVIDLSKCDGCGLCANVCSRGVLVLIGNRIVALEEVECG
ncbi:4Fe-4S binding protein, partial [Chloroflexota bacterium]